jgi:DNA-binding response OmpR family regulator
MSARTILVVDDEVIWLRLLHRLFTHHGYLVMTASSCTEGVAAARKAKPDCAILDFNLGDGTAAEVCEALRTTWGYKGVPVIIFSSDPDAEECLSGEHKADILVFKDSPVSKLVFLVEKLLAVCG